MIFLAGSRICKQHGTIVIPDDVSDCHSFVVIKCGCIFSSLRRANANAGFARFNNVQQSVNTYVLIMNEARRLVSHEKAESQSARSVRHVRVRTSSHSALPHALSFVCCVGVRPHLFIVQTQSIEITGCRYGAINFPAPYTFRHVLEDPSSLRESLSP